MSLKSKLFGIGAVSVLALSMTTGVMAQTEMEAESFGPPSDVSYGEVKTDAQVKLTEGICSVAVTASNANFGEGKWDGTKYIGSGSGSITLGIQNLKYKKSCDVHAKADDLKSDDRSNRDTIDAENLRMTNPAFQFTNNHKKLMNIAPGAERPHASDLTLNVPNNVKPDTYKGKLYFQIVQGL